jgi:hypothetical protein
LLIIDIGYNLDSCLVKGSPDIRKSSDKIND